MLAYNIKFFPLMSIPFFYFFHFLCSFFLSTSFTVFYVSFYLHFTCFFVIKLFQSFTHSLLASMSILVELNDSLSLMLISPVIRFVRCMCLRHESLFYVILPSIRWTRSFLPRHCNHKKIKKIALSCDALKKRRSKLPCGCGYALNLCVVFFRYL